jgi:PAS domain S-box-containing protein
LPDGTFVKINRTFLNWIGYDASELLFQKKFQDLLPIGGKIYYDTHFGPLLQMQGFVNEVQFDIKGRQGQQLPVLVNTIQIKGEDEKPLLHRTTVFNITDRRKYEQELLRAKKEAEAATRVKAEFLSTVSHEIRTPMNAIISIANLLQEMKHTGEQEEYFRILKLSADNLLHLINDILDYSKIEAGRVMLAERSLNLRELISALLYSLNITAEEKGLTIRTDIDERLPAHVLGDPVKIGQVLTNLLSNAIKFTEKGHVLLQLQVQELTQEEVSVDFHIQDTGIGIPQDRLEKVFEEYTQADYETNLKYGGTGLGLTISQKLLALYGSKLAVKSEEGKGTEFSFNLRLKLGKDTSPKKEGIASHPEPSLQGVKLLLVDDNPINVMVVSKYLEKWGIDVDVAGDGAEAVAKVRQQEYELVLMDLQMPGMDGYEATSTIRNFGEDKYRRLPVIALSASSSVDHKDRMDAAGINDFVSKPFNAEVLQSKIAFYTRGLTRHAPEVAVVPPDPGPARQPAQGHPNAPAFILETFEELLEGNQEDLRELIRMHLVNFESYKKEFCSALQAQDLKEYNFCKHRIKITLELLQAHRLEHAIIDGRNLLQAGVEDKDRIESACQAIIREFDVVILGLKEILLSRWPDTLPPGTSS